MMEWLIIGVFLFTILWVCCKVSSECSRKEEQEEAKRKLEGKEYMLDDSNWKDSLVYDDEFVKASGKKNGKKKRNK